MPVAINLLTIMKILRLSCLVVFSLFLTKPSFSQGRSKSDNLVYVDKQGILRYTKGNAEAAFFGVNYTTPFAYAFRAHKALKVDLKKAIQQDVYHMARLGLDAFRVHVWDTEITDTAGNLIANEHLELFDFLLAELRKRNIKSIITPIAFWGNGYPERDENTPGFARKFGKGRSTTNDTAIAAQENYLRQFFKHINPYTKLTYVSDPDVIAVELNNEPSHSGPKSGVTDYVNRLAAAVRSTGFTKPLYYNISQNPYYADAVATANVDGVSFQWYPSGLVANHEVKGNFLPNVDVYAIPFDTIPAYRTKSKMVYEYDAADILQSYMYPAMARSFRSAGFQWATQFAYDPMALAYANSEYQTHYNNLAYSPSKAISLLIASRVFHSVPRLKSYGVYPADSAFADFRVSYKNSLSEMNSPQAFYYSGTTVSKPVTVEKLEHIAGVGSSPVIQYNGTGAYFMDKAGDGVWRLEVMPDAIFIRDPFEKASPKKEVTRIEWRTQPISIQLPSLGENFSVKAVNENNSFKASVTGTQFLIRPGAYLITMAGFVNASVDAAKIHPLALNEFVAPEPFSKEPFVKHDPLSEVSSGRPFLINATMVGVNPDDIITVQVNRFGGGFGQAKTLTMMPKEGYKYSTEVPAELAMPGRLDYRIIIQKANGKYAVFPGNYQGNPFAWDFTDVETWKVMVAGEDSVAEIFDATTDHDIFTFPTFRRGFETSYVTASEPKRLLLRLNAKELSADHVMAFQYFFADKLKGRKGENFDKLVIRARTLQMQTVNATITLTNADAMSWSVTVPLSNTLQDIEVPLSAMKSDSVLLLPRPYPGFMPLYFKGAGTAAFEMDDMQKITISIGLDLSSDELKKPAGIEVEYVQLRKGK